MKYENTGHIFSFFVLTFFYLFSCDFSNSLIILDTHDHCVCLSNYIALGFFYGVSLTSAPRLFKNARLVR